MAGKKIIFILAGICCLLLALLLIDGNPDRRGGDNQEENYLPELKHRLAEITAIQIKSNQDSVVLEMQNNAWHVASRDNYPAQTNLIRQLIYGIAELTIVEIKTADESLLDKIDLAERSGDAVRVKLMDASGNTISDILFGKSQAALSGQGKDWFVRQFDDSQSWLVNGVIPLYASANQWLDKTVLSLDRDEIREVVLIPDPDDRLVIRRDDESMAFELQDIQPGDEVETYELDEIVDAARTVVIDDVRVKAADRTSSDETAVVLKTNGGLSVEITVADSEQGWISLIAKVEVDDQAVVDQAQAFNDQWSPWEYKIAKYKLDTLLQDKNDLI